MGFETRDQRSRVEDSSLVHPDPNPNPNPNIGSNKPADEGGKFTSPVDSSSSIPHQCLELEGSSSFSSSDLDLLYQGLQRLQCNKPKNRRLKGRRKSSRSVSGCNKSNAGKCGGNVCRGQQVCTCAASYVADCAAVCCCPCAIVHLFILAFVVAPCVLARKAFCYVKKKAKRKHCKRNDDDDHGDDDDDDDDDDERGTEEYYTNPWSCTQSPVGVPLRTKVDTEMVWWELYAAGHMGFGGLPFERD